MEKIKIDPAPKDEIDEGDAVAESGNDVAGVDGDDYLDNIKLHLSPDQQDKSDADNLNLEEPKQEPVDDVETFEGTSAQLNSNSDDKINSQNDGTMDDVEVKKEIKRSRDVTDWSSDEEEFAGFEDCNGNVKDKYPRRKKVKEEPLSEAESQGYEEDFPFEIKVEKQDVKLEKDTSDESVISADVNQTTVTPAPTPTPPAPTQTPPAPVVKSPPKIIPPPTPQNVAVAPNYRKPFDFGWKRELVHRAPTDDRRSKSDKDKPEVYYIAPTGKKVRSRNELQSYLTDGLDISNFTFAKEPLGMTPEEEIIRTAKAYHQTSRRANFLDLGEPDPSLGFGKRIPKPKMPKGASPPPPSTKPARAATPATKKVDTETENKAPAKTPKSSKAKGEPCTIQCVLAMGTIPQLQCKKCLCLYHHECVGLEKFNGPIANYICECCLWEIAHPNEARLLKASQNQANTSQPQLQTNAACLSGTQPVSSVVASTTSVALPPIQQAISVSAIADKNIKGNKRTPTPPTMPSSRSVRNNRSNSKELSGGSVIGGMTTWVPPTANLASSRSQLDIETAPPQSIAIVAGRKYIMVPKSNLMSVSPSGEVRIGDNNGTPLPYVNDFSMNISKNPVSGTGSTLTTGEDVSPPFKKRLLTRSTSKPQTPTGSPSHSAAVVVGGSPPKVSNLIQQNLNEKRSQVSVITPSVHKLFAANFFNNVSLGYDILLHTFQYLKVQELLRASCVCRMWNQAANHHSLWRTVRMKNSQVNDWSGFADTLKRNGTKHLDLRKMLIVPGNNDTTWQNFTDNIGKVTQLESIDLCRCSSTVVETLVESNPRLKVINAVSIKDEHLKLSGFHRVHQLTELRLKSLNQMHIDSLSSLRALKHLKHLSLTSVKDLGNKNIEVLGHLSKLETLELGECSEFTADFSLDVLSNLSFLERLRLEKGQDNCSLFDILDTVAQLRQLSHLELVNFDIKSGFDVHLQRCTNLKRLLIIPTYISQSATTNHMILKGVLDLADHLEQLTWVVTLELLRVTELYVDQYNCKRKDLKQPEDKIPVLKPIPGMSEEELKSRNTQRPFSDAPQVEIIPLVAIENILAAKMPKTKCSILKVPFLATWRQNMVELQ